MRCASPLHLSTDKEHTATRIPLFTFFRTKAKGRQPVFLHFYYFTTIVFASLYAEYILVASPLTVTFL